MSRGGRSRALPDRKNEVGLDQYQARRHDAWYTHITLAMTALAFLAITRAQLTEWVQYARENKAVILFDSAYEAYIRNPEIPHSIYEIEGAREVAIVRAKQEGAVVVLGSATPSLESWVNAESGKYRPLYLPDRVGGGRLPAIEVVDLRHRPSAAASTDGRRKSWPA